MAPIQRGWISAIWDKYSGWRSGLPGESCGYTIEKVHIPMEDGVNLVADLYRPSLSAPQKPSGTLLVRGPYGRDSSIAMGTVRVFAARGYQAILVSCRGTFGSEGVFEPARNDDTDGRAVVEWMRDQAWYTGSFATLGPSYLGFTQWCLLSWPDGPPKDMKAAVIYTGPHNFIAYGWDTGAFSSVFIFWAAFMRRMLGDGRTPLLVWLWQLQREVPRIFEGIPLIDAVDTYFGGESETPQWVREMITISDTEDPRWRATRQGHALNQADMPILLSTGWYDAMKDQVMEQYARLSERGCQVSLIIGPWTHLQAGGGNTPKETLAWLEKHLAGHDVANPLSSPLRVFITGAEEWRDLEAWPPATKAHELYVSSGMKLSENKPITDLAESTFEFNPASPTPAIGCASQFGLSPANEDTILASRPDVLAFTTEPLGGDLEVCGKPTVELHHSTSTPFADLLVRLSEVDAKGVSRNITETYMRLDDKRPKGRLQIEIPDCGHRFLKGNRIRLIIAGGSHPRYIRNFGTGEAPGRETTMCSVRHTIFHHESALSKVTLPAST